VPPGRFNLTAFLVEDSVSGTRYLNRFETGVNGYNYPPVGLERGQGLYAEAEGLEDVSDYLLA